MVIFKPQIIKYIMNQFKHCTIIILELDSMAVGSLTGLLGQLMLIFLDLEGIINLIFLDCILDTTYIQQHTYNIHATDI